MDDLIKVRIPISTPRGPMNESLWAKRLSANTAELNNTPWFALKFSLGDIVEFDPDTGNVLSLIEKKTNAILCTFDAPDKFKVWKKIVKHFKSSGISCESAFEGIFSVAVPLTISKSELHTIIKKCPISIEVQKEGFPEESMPTQCGVCGDKLSQKIDR